MLYYTVLTQNGQPAAELLQRALMTAYKQHKNIFITFSATSCGPCKELKRGLHDVYNVQFFESNYILLELYNSELEGQKHLENYGGDSILKRYGGDTTSVPYWIILAPNGRKLHGESGFSSNPEELQKFVKVLKGNSHLNPGELKMI